MDGFVAIGQSFNNSLGFKIPACGRVQPLFHVRRNRDSSADCSKRTYRLPNGRGGGFTGTAGTIGPEFNLFDDGKGSPVPAPTAVASVTTIRQAVLARLNTRRLTARCSGNYFPSVKSGGPIDFTIFAPRYCEFEIHPRIRRLASIDLPADRRAMTVPR